MSNHQVGAKHDRALNIYVSREMKRSLDEIAKRHDKTLATVVRSLLRIGIPILSGIWEAEQRMLNDPVGLFSRAESQHEND